MDTNTKCLACNSTLEVIYYQRRAADEPPDKVVYCKYCPLDTGRLSLSSFEGVHGTSNSKNKSNSTTKNFTFTNFSSIRKTSTKGLVIVRGRAALQCKSKLQSMNVAKDAIVAIPIYVLTEAKPIASYYYLSSSIADQAHIDTISNTLGPLITYREVDVYQVNKEAIRQVNSTNKVIVGYEYKLPSIKGCISTSLRTLHDGQKPYILLVLENKDNTTILNVLRSILNKYGTELTVKSIMTNTLLNTLFIQSGRAYDWPSAPDNGYTYAWKPDGERFWYIRYGSVWFFCRRLLSGKIIGWNICNSIYKFNGIGPVVDIEVMIGHSPILIDLLIDDNSQPMPVSRTLDTVIDQYISMKEQGIIDVPIHIRDYYRSDKDLLRTKDELQYPVDGVVGIQDGSMTIIKLKDKKSIELQLTDNGDLVTSDEYVVATSELHNSEEIGSIVEIRFEKQSTSDLPIITEVFVRTDKTKANDMQACINIMNSISDTPESLARRNVVQWCAAIRSKINKIASQIVGKGRIILDIGAGDGQAVSDYSSDPEVTYLLLEPNDKKCKSMYRRLQDLDKNSVKLFYGSSNILNSLRLLTTKKVKYVVLCASLRDILEQKDCIRTLKDCIRCCIASLSISYIVEELHELAIDGIDVIGFGYMYDSANKNGILISQYGVTMKQDIKTKIATVSWGTDRAYTENAIVTEDFKEVFYCKLATNLVPLVSDSTKSLLTTVSSKVYTITTIKYMV